MKKIEKRYLVIKISDIEKATQEGFLEHGALGSIQQIVKEIEYFRKESGKDPLRALVVEKDWPEYPVVHEALESRINDIPAAMMFSRENGQNSPATMAGYTSYLERDQETGKLVKLHIDEYKYVHQPRFHSGGVVKDFKLTLSPGEIPSIVSPPSMLEKARNFMEDAGVTLNFSGVISHDQACAKAMKNIPGRAEDPDIKVFKWKDVDMSTGTEKWFEHTHCINWLSACPKCKTTAARVKSSSMDSNHLLDNDTVECVCCGNTGHIEIFNSDADVAWDVADGE